MRTVAWPLAALSVFAVAACTYTPDEEYFKPVDHPDDPGLSIKLNDYPDGDTIYIYSTTEFNFSVDTDNRPVDDVEVLLGNQVISTSLGRFSISSNYQSSGTYELKIQFKSPSRTGSLADKLGLEKYQVWKKWIVKADFEGPPKPVLKFSIENGFLKLSWDKYTKPNFEYYVISGQNGSATGAYIDDPQQNFWIDSAYVGGFASYSVSIQWGISTARSDEVYRSDPFMFQADFNDADSTIKMSWRKTPFYGPFKEIQIYEGGRLINTIADRSDTTLVYEPIGPVLLGRPVEMVFLIQLKNGQSNGWNSPMTPHVKAYLGDKIPRNYLGLTWCDGFKGYAGWAGDYMYRYDQNFNLIDSIAGGLHTGSTISYVGNYEYYGEVRDMVKANLVTHQKEVFTYNRAMTVHDGGGDLISFRYSVPGSPTRYYKALFNMALLKEVYTTDDWDNEPLHVSEDGKYFLGPSNGVFRVDGESVQLIGTVKYAYDFRKDDTSELLCMRAGFVDIYDTNTLTLKRTVTLPTVFRPNWLGISYDPISHYLIYGTLPSYGVNIDTDKKITFTAEDNFFYPFSIGGGYVFHFSGYRLKIF